MQPPPKTLTCTVDMDIIPKKGEYVKYGSIDGFVEKVSHKIDDWYASWERNGKTQVSGQRSTSHTIEVFLK